MARKRPTKEESEDEASPPPKTTRKTRSATRKQDSDIEDEVAPKKKTTKAPSKKVVDSDSEDERKPATKRKPYGKKTEIDSEETPKKRVVKPAPKSLRQDSDSEDDITPPKKKTPVKKAGKSNDDDSKKKNKASENSQKYFVFPKDTLLTIFSYLDTQSLKKAEKAFPEWSEILKDDDVWKQLTLSRFPRVKQVPLQLNKKLSSWKQYYLLRLPREEIFKSTLLQKYWSKFDHSAVDFDRFFKELHNARAYRQLAGYFPNKDFKKGELALLADSLVYEVVNIKEENNLRVSVPSGDYTTSGYIPSLDGKIISWKYRHFVSFSRGDTYNNEGPTITIGKSSLFIDDGEDITGFVKAVYKELNLKKTTLSDLLDFIMSYMKPASSLEYCEALDNAKEELTNDDS